MVKYLEKNLDNEHQRQMVLKQCFEYLIEHGIENTSIRDLQQVTGLSSSSIYYWFNDKYTLIVSAVEYGLEQIAKGIFREAIESINDFGKFMERLPYIILDYRKQLRIVIQIATSPQYSKALKEISLSLALFYDSFSEELASKMKADKEKARALVYLAVSTVIHMVVFGDVEVAKMELESISDSFKTISNITENKKEGE